jgi:hypothetical protein
VFEWNLINRFVSGALSHQETACRMWLEGKITRHHRRRLFQRFALFELS